MERVETSNFVGILDVEICLSPKSCDESLPLILLSQLLKRQSLKLGHIGRIDVIMETQPTMFNASVMWKNLSDSGKAEMDMHQHFGAAQHHTLPAILDCLHWIDSRAWDGRYGVIICVERGMTTVCLLGRLAPLHFDLKSRSSYFVDEAEANVEVLKARYLSFMQYTDDSAAGDILFLRSPKEQTVLHFPSSDSDSVLLQLASLFTCMGDQLNGRKLVLNARSTAPAMTFLTVLPRSCNGDSRFTLAGLQQYLKVAVAQLQTEEAVVDLPDNDYVAQTIRKPQVRVVITGVSAAVPGRDGAVFTPGVNNIQRIINGECFISPIPDHVKDAMLEKNVCIQSKNKEGATVSRPVTTYADTINVCATLGKVDLTAYGIAESIISTMDSAVQVAIAAGLEALRDAGLVTGSGPGTTGWELPAHMQDSTGVVYATSFPALDTAIAEVSKFFAANSVGAAAATVLVEELRRRLQSNCGEALSSETDAALKQLESLIKETATAEVNPEPYQFDRKFLFRVLVLGNAQLAQIIKSRGPNMQTNAACAGATQAIALAYDMIQVGRAERVVVIAGDSASSDTLMPWLGNGFRILGAATLCSLPSEAARPFQAQRSGMILGSGGIGMVLESEAAALERFATLGQDASAAASVPLRAPTPFRCRLLSTLLSNSAYHGAAMDKHHIAAELERFVVGIEQDLGIPRRELAQQGVYFSHETGTHASPASSCAANEIYGLRKVFGEHLKDLLILNTKGFTGHPMGVSFEDVVAVDVLATGRVPPVANFTAVDPYLGDDLKISRGGVYSCKYAIRFAAGFGSQIALALYGSA